MLSIGEFAGITGLSVKALRHYDEKGVLRPEFVDPTTGYRRYGVNQVRPGVIVRTLRDAGVGLPAVAAAIVDGDAQAALDRHRERVVALRADEDRAFETAQHAIAGYGAPVEVSRREVGAQPFVGRVLAMDGAALTDDDADEQFARLFTRVQELGLGPTGPGWTTVRVTEHGDADLVCCWPTSELMDLADAAGDDGEMSIEVGTLPARVELVATWPNPAATDLPEGTAHPAVVGLFDAVAEGEVAALTNELRQSVAADGAGGHRIEMAITIAAR